ncbi:hypothetical protein KGQ20_38525 [Catenulispora sp. NF23]|uniref:hypothetical protein n=1 Tax=Catenulispora pinistramenti TaxID=2705254 RepID=UPI001BA7532B|nr:hypothetical protein [Catenulispora pinistramenti]MBS2538659.1 hypothetical protein [Catenulispora pinistramenti]
MITDEARSSAMRDDPSQDAPQRLDAFDLVESRRAVLGRIADVLAATLPSDWSTVMVRCSALGDRLEGRARVVHLDGAMRPWRLTDDAMRLFRELRELGDVPPLVSWFSVDYRLWADGRFEGTFGHDEPVFPEPSSPEDYRREVEIFKEAGFPAPGWVGAGAGADRADDEGGADGDPAIRIAKVFDGADATGTGYFDAEHPTVDPDAREQLLRYLDAGSALLVTTARDDDVRNPGLGAVVPIDFRTDGTWIWNDALTYYVRTYGLVPEPEFGAHMAGLGFVCPEVSDAVQRAALKILMPS